MDKGRYLLWQREWGNSTHIALCFHENKTDENDFKTWKKDAITG